MYYPARPAAKPWSIAHNFACFRPDKMTSENQWYRKTIRHIGSDSVMRRVQRKQQRRLNKYLCRLDTAEW